MSDEKKTNWEEAVKRTYYVAWVIWVIFGVLWVTREPERIHNENVFSMLLWAVLPYFPYVAAKWIYAGYKKS